MWKLFPGVNQETLFFRVGFTYLQSSRILRKKSKEIQELGLERKRLQLKGRRSDEIAIHRPSGQSFEVDRKWK